MQLMKRRPTWAPLREMEEFTKRMNRLFDLTKWPEEDRELLAATDWSPSCDIKETDKAYLIHVELPNVKKDDVHVTLEDGILTLQGERREEKEEKDTHYRRRELSYGHFLRRFTMPGNADESKVDATYKDGMLNVTIGKSNATEQKGKEIEIK